jgi:CO/xanthine dehydrogenase FAD-binding subunit
VKPPPFTYYRPATEAEAVELLREHGGGARVLAGGQSLVPMLNFRLARPQCLVDIGRVASLAFIRVQEERLLIGAGTRQSAVERSTLVAERWPLLRSAVLHVGLPQTRNRGTIGGSVAHADAAAEIPVALAALDACVHLRSSRGTRVVRWSEFFRFEFVTDCAEDEMVTAVEIPTPREGSGSSFHEHATRHGDFATAGAASTLTLDEDGRCTHASLALLACGPAPVRAHDAEAVLVGAPPTGPAAAEAAERALAVAEFRRGHSDLPERYRRRLLRSLVEAAIDGAARKVEAAPTPAPGP